MSIADELTEKWITYKRPNRRSLDLICSELGEEGTEVMEALSEKHDNGEWRFPATSIANLLQDRGYEISVRTVQRYRNDRIKGNK